MNFFDRLDRYGQQTALIEMDGTKTTYHDLQCEIETLSKRLPSHRSVVVIESSNSKETLASYLCCVQYNHVPLLIDAGLNPNLKTLVVETYRPNILITPHENTLIVKEHDASCHFLHPDLAILLSTSGSTGSPKLVRISKSNLNANASSIAAYLRLTAEDRAVTTLPLHYSYGLSIINSHLAVGASVLITEEGLFSTAFWKAVTDFSITSLSGVPYIYEMLKRLNLSRMELPSIRYLTQAGGKLAVGLVQEFAELCELRDWQFFVMYGQTEATARIGFLDPQKVMFKPSSIGQSISGGRLWLIDKEGKEITSANIDGEMVFRGPNVMMGYAKSADDLALGDELNGTLYTGDIAHFDEDGDFYITGRKKRFVKMFGLRFSLDHVETLLRRKGFECACNGYDNRLLIAVRDRNDSKPVKQLITSEYKLNHTAVEVVVVETFPKTSSGKIEYDRLFKNYLE